MIQGQRIHLLLVAATIRKLRKIWKFKRREKVKAIKEGVQSIFDPPLRQN